MKRFIKLTIFILALLIVYFTYGIFINQNRKIIYIPLGDSIAEGMTPYHSIDYGYTDYIADYLKSINNLSFYTKKYTKSGYTIENVRNDINNNKTIEEEGRKYHLKEILRESDLVTITVGANDFIKGKTIKDLSVKSLDIVQTKKELDIIAKDYKELLILIKKYAKNKIIVVGYFNPLPSLTLSKDSIDESIKYFNNLIEDICEEVDVIYVDVFNVLNDNPDVFSDRLDIHPNKKGYELISKEVIKKIE